MEILNKITSELLENKGIISILTFTPYKELGLLHFSVGMYIRNQYLWHNNKNYKALSAYYNTLDIDRISNLIIKDVYLLLHKK